MAGSNGQVNATSKPYPTFYVLKVIQFISSVFVGATWSYLFYQLSKNHREVLGAFYFIAAIAFLSIIVVAVTACVVLLSGPQPPFGMVIISLCLMAMWIGDITVLSHHMSGTLASPCDLVHFGGSTGITICKLYKALFGITIVALVSFVAGVGLDMYRLWQAHQRDVSHLSDTKQQKEIADEV